jgi:hypothetical protein
MVIAGHAYAAMHHPKKEKMIIQAARSPAHVNHAAVGPKASQSALQFALSAHSHLPARTPTPTIKTPCSASIYVCMHAPVTLRQRSHHLGDMQKVDGCCCMGDSGCKHTRFVLTSNRKLMQLQGSSCSCKTAASRSPGCHPTTGPHNVKTQRHV